MADLRIVDHPIYPGRTLQEHFAWDGSAYCIHPEQDIEGDPLLPNRHKFLKSHGDYQFICYTESFVDSCLMRIILEANVYTPWEKVSGEDVGYVCSGYLTGRMAEKIAILKRKGGRKMENRIVTFDGESLFFQVNGVEIKNGKYPDVIQITEDYTITADSLLKLLVVMKEGALGATEAKCLTLDTGKSVIRLYYHDGFKNEYIEKLKTAIKEKVEDQVKEIDLLREKVKLGEQYEKENNRLKYLLEAHNESPWMKRIYPINYK